MGKAKKKVSISEVVPPTVTLSWEEGPLSDLEVICRGVCSIGLLLLFQREDIDLEKRSEHFTRFGDEVLVEWNLVDTRGVDIPANGIGMNAVPTSLAWDVINQWVQAIAGVPVPLEPA